MGSLSNTGRSELRKKAPVEKACKEQGAGSKLGCRVGVQGSGFGLRDQGQDLGFSVGV